MPVSESYLTFVVDQLNCIGDVAARRMFGDRRAPTAADLNRKSLREEFLRLLFSMLTSNKFFMLKNVVNYD